VESKDLEMLVKDSSTGLKFQERCRGLLRSVRLSNQESVWLLDIFDELVAAKDSRVFKDQSKPGFPCVLAQHCFNRHGDFLVIEEYNDRERCGSVLIPNGRLQKGWESFASELWIAINFVQPFLAAPSNMPVKKRGVLQRFSCPR
jgi:hypothetical protein